MTSTRTYGSGVYGTGLYGLSGTIGRVADYRLEIAFNENVAGVFTVDTSPLDGTDGLTDKFLFDGTFDDITDDVDGAATVTFGTDALAGQVQAGTMSLTVLRTDPDLTEAENLAYWNPANAASPLNADAPGFVPMRPGRLTAIFDDGTEELLFLGFLESAEWKREDGSCDLNFEDILLRASRTYPTIASTGPTTTGAVLALLFTAVGWTGEIDFDDGDQLDDFSADGTVDVVTIIGNLLQTERGTVFIAANGVPTFRDRSRVRTAAPVATITDEPIDQQTAIDLASIYTRATVTKTLPNGTAGTTWTSVSTVAENRYGRSDFPAIESTYVPTDAVGGLLAEDIVYEASNPLQTATIVLDNQDDPTLSLMVTTPLLSVLTLDGTLGGTTGDFSLQRIRHTIATQYHKAELLLSKRWQREMTVDGSALDGPDGLRY